MRLKKNKTEKKWDWKKMRLKKNKTGKQQTNLILVLYFIFIYLLDT